MLPVGFPSCLGPPEQRWVWRDRGLLLPCTLPSVVNLFGRDFSPKNSTFSNIRQWPAGMGLPESLVWAAKLDVTIVAPAQCPRTATEEDSKWPGIADSVHSAELPGLRGAPACPILQGPRPSGPQLQGPPPAYKPNSLGRGPLGVRVDSGLCRRCGARELGLRLES